MHMLPNKFTRNHSTLTSSISTIWNALSAERTPTISRMHARYARNIALRMALNGIQLVYIENAFQIAYHFEMCVTGIECIYQGLK